MYKKEVRINGKKYSYYYYNLREGRVRHVCLGSDKNLYLDVFKSDLGGGMHKDV